MQAKSNSPDNPRLVRGFQPAASSTSQAGRAKDSRECKQMMLAFFWSVADCNLHGCTVQWDTLCTSKEANQKKTQKIRRKRKKKEMNCWGGLCMSTFK